MKLQLILAWRNLWRNPRRTAVILISIIVGIWMMLFMGAVMWGMVDSMLETSLANLTGHIQITHPRYLEDPVIENRIDDPDSLESILSSNLPPGSWVAWRVRLETVASNARHSAGVMLVGTEFTVAREVTFLKTAQLDGSIPIMDSSKNLVVGRELIDDFETRLGHKLILMSRDVEGERATAAFRIQGSFDTFLESNETGLIFAPLPAVQEFLGLGNAITEVSIHLPDIEETGIVADNLRYRLDSERYTVTPWQESIPMVTAYIQIWDYFSYVWGLVVFLAMAFGLVNTLLMAVYERIREFGLVRALGMHTMRIVGGILLEASLLLFVGLLLGNVLALLAIGWFQVHGIDLASFSDSSEIFGLSRMIYPKIQLKDFYVFNSMVFGLGLLISLYPAWRAARFTPVEAMTHFK